MFWALFFYFLYSSSFKYNCLVQDYGRALYTIGKGFLDVGRPPLRFYEHPFFFFSYCIRVYTFLTLCWDLVCLILSIGVNFDYITKIYQVCLVYECFFFLTRCTYHPNLGTIILSSLIRPTISHSNNELLCLFSLSSSMIWTNTAFILSRLELWTDMPCQVLSHL